MPAAGGFFSTLLVRVRGWCAITPASPWPDETAGETSDQGGGGANAEAVRELVERKRRHERVRQREFDHLRRLRQRGIGAAPQTAATQASRLDSGMTGMPQERERTLRKIDQAEAQMVRAWWRRARPGGAAPTPVPTGAASAPARAAPLSDATLPPATTFAATVMPPAGPVELPAASAPIAVVPPVAPVSSVPGPETPVARLPEPDAELARRALHWALAGTEELAGDEAVPSSMGLVTRHVPRLQGDLSGDIDALLAALAAPSSPGAPLEIACGGLRRVDFAAAGCLLDWAQEQQARGRQVRLCELPPLVATFLHVVGLGVHAQLIARTA